MFAKSKVLLIGSGGVGTIVALNLESGGLASVTAVLRSNYEEVTCKGFAIRSCDHGNLTNWRPSKIIDHIPSHEDVRFDYIVCTTKNIPDQPPRLVELIAPAVTRGHTVIVLLQNGINIEKPLFSAFPENTVLSGISYIRSHELQSGVIDHIDHDKLIIGAFPNPDPKYDDEGATVAGRHFASIYGASSKITVVQDPNVIHSRWRKLIYNACMNSICAVTGLDTGRVQQTDSLIGGIVRPAMREIVAAAKASGVDLGEEVVQEVIDGLEDVGMRFALSMLVDVEKGNTVEFENIVGEPLRMGTALGVSMPTLHVIYHILKAYQWRTVEQRKAALGIKA